MKNPSLPEYDFLAVIVPAHPQRGEALGAIAAGPGFPPAARAEDGRGGGEAGEMGGGRRCRFARWRGGEEVRLHFEDFL
jgi:hypothetical protein